MLQKILEKVFDLFIKSLVSIVVGVVYVTAYIMAFFKYDGLSSIKHWMHNTYDNIKDTMKGGK